MNRAALALLLALPLAAVPQRVIVDTDSGFFGDDGQALVMLLRSPGSISVAGVTLVSGNVWAPQGAVDTARVLELLGRSGVPLYLGAARPLRHDAAMVKREAALWGPLGFRGAFAEPLPMEARAPRKQTAVDFLIQAVEHAPGQITLVEIGPMTNLAAALRLKPGLAGKIRRLVFMGGSLRARGNATPAAEFNFWFDPEAAAAVLRSPIPEKVMFGLDICDQAVITRADFDRIVAVKTPITALYREDMGNRYPGFLKNPRVTGRMWDTLVAAWLLDPAVVTSSDSAFLDVETAFGPRYGAAIPLRRHLVPHATPVRVMRKVNLARAMALYQALLTR